MYSSQLKVQDASKFNIGDVILVYNGSAPPSSEKPQQSLYVDNQKVDADGELQNKSEAEIINEYKTKIKEMESFTETAAKKALEIKSYYKQYAVFKVEAAGLDSLTISPPTNCQFDYLCFVFVDYLGSALILQFPIECTF